MLEGVEANQSPKIISPRVSPRGKGSIHFDDHLFHQQGCCLNNHLLTLLIKLQRLCSGVKGRPGDVVLVPEELETHGMWGLYDAAAIEALKAEGALHNCTFVTSEQAKKLPGMAYRRKRGDINVIDVLADGPFHCWMYTQMRIPADIREGFSTCVEEMSQVFGSALAPAAIRNDPLAALRSLDYTAVHARIEKDWLNMCHKKRKNKGHLDKKCYNMTEIAEAARADTVLSGAKNAALIHGNGLAAEDTGQNHPKLVWSRTLDGSRVFDRTMSKCGAATHIGRSGIKSMIVDFLIASQASRYLGHFGSTFSVGVLQGRLCKSAAVGEAAQGDNAVYSCPPAAEANRLNVRSIGRCAVDGVWGPGWGGFIRVRFSDVSDRLAKHAW